MMRDAKSLARAGHGFTLIEFAIVIVLLGLFIGVVTPGLQDFRARHALRAAAHQMAADIRGLQGEAAGCRSKGLTSEDTMFSVCFYPEAEAYQMKRTGEGGWSRTVTLPSGINMVATTFPRDPYGREMLVVALSGVSSAGGTVTLRSTETGEDLYVIVTSLSGRVRVSETPPESWEVD